MLIDLQTEIEESAGKYLETVEKMSHYLDNTIKAFIRAVEGLGFDSDSNAMKELKDLKNSVEKHIIVFWEKLDKMRGCIYEEKHYMDLEKAYGVQLLVRPEVLIYFARDVRDLTDETRGELYKFRENMEASVSLCMTEHYQMLIQKLETKMRAIFDVCEKVDEECWNMIRIAEIHMP